MGAASAPTISMSQNAHPGIPNDSIETKAEKAAMQALPKKARKARINLLVRFRFNMTGIRIIVSVS